jgi:hypothetical protein
VRLALPCLVPAPSQTSHIDCHVGSSLPDAGQVSAQPCSASLRCHAGGALAITPETIRAFYRKKAKDPDAAAKKGGPSRFAESLKQGVAMADVRYGVDRHRCQPDGQDAGSQSNGHPPAAIVHIDPIPLQATAIPEGKHIVHIVRLGQKAVAQVLRPFTSGCMRNAFESEAVEGGHDTIDIRNDKARVTGHTIEVADVNYTRPSFLVQIGGLAGAHPVRLGLINDEQPGVSRILGLSDMLRCPDGALDGHCTECLASKHEVHRSQALD